MILHEIPTEVKELIFTHVTPNEWINTGKVSNEWLVLTLRSIKKVESCHALILSHLAEFINKQRNTNYTWVSLLAMMSKLEHLECFENTEAFWTEISPICHQLKVLDCKPRHVESFAWNKLEISFKNLIELRWEGSHEGAAFLLKIFELAPELEKITLKDQRLNAEWKDKIPKSVEHISLQDVMFVDQQQCSIQYICEDTSNLITFSAYYPPFNHHQYSYISHFFKAIRLKKLVLSHPTASDILKDAFTKCPNLEIVCVDSNYINVTDSWRKSVPASVKAFKALRMSVADNVRRDFSLDWLFQNYGALQSLEVESEYWTGFEPQKFHSLKNLKKLYLKTYMHYLDDDELIDPFSDICFHMIAGSHLVDVELHGSGVDESWRHISLPQLRD